MKDDTKVMLVVTACFFSILAAVTYSSYAVKLRKLSCVEKVHDGRTASEARAVCGLD
jgi:hypothetical protein